MSNSIDKALFVNALFSTPGRFKFPDAGNASNSSRKPCSINVTNILNVNKVKIYE